ncbi:MAG: hypothetical protein WDN04_20165 [Rhodospirillales bacterium]
MIDGQCVDLGLQTLVELLRGGTDCFRQKLDAITDHRAELVGECDTRLVASGFEVGHARIGAADWL